MMHSDRPGPAWRKRSTQASPEDSGALPVRAPRVRPNRDHKQVPAQDDVCHLCGAASIAMCPQCRLPVCATHQEDLEPELATLFGPWACAECAARGRAELQLDRSQWQRKRAGDVGYRTCDVCGRVFDQVLPACVVCGKRMCREHRLRYRKRFRFGRRPGAQTGGWYWDYDVRCPTHRLNPLLARLKGWQLEATGSADEAHAQI